MHRSLPAYAPAVTHIGVDFGDAPARCMAHYEVSSDVVAHCLLEFEHLGRHGSRLGLAMMTTIARPSAASLFLTLLKANEAIGTATGFVVERGNAFLVTNRHVVLGINALPETLVIKHNRAGALGQYEDKVEPLYDGDGNPLWYEHPTLGEVVDVAALPLTDTSNVDLLSYDPWAPGPGLRAGVSDPLNIIGFPFGITVGAALGVWTRGFVASEPDIDWQDRPAFLIDSRTRTGQSGSPVIAYANGGAVTLANGSAGIFGGPVEQFFGIYSGRINAESDLGIVWKPRALREVIDGKRRPQRRAS